MKSFLLMFILILTLPTIALAQEDEITTPPCLDAEAADSPAMEIPMPNQPDLLPAFDAVSTQTLETSQIFSLVSPPEEPTYSLTITVGETDATRHDFESGQFTLDACDRAVTIDEETTIHVGTAYSQPVVVNGEEIVPAAVTLAFDLQIEDTYIAGEISRLDGDPGEDEELLTAMVSFIEELFSPLEVTCGDARSCSEMTSCEQAMACLAEGNQELDGNRDGIPCPALCKD